MTTATNITAASTICSTTVDNASIVIYTDGSAFGNPGPSGWGAVVLLLNENATIIDKAEINGPSRYITTNNRAELAAAIYALAFVRQQQTEKVWPVCPITLISDAQYVVTNFTERLPGWIAQGWRTSDKKPVKNRDLWDRLMVESEGLAVTWRWVKGHDGDQWNEQAHLLATRAAKEAERQGITFRPAWG